MRIFYRLVFLCGLFVLGSCTQLLQIANRFHVQKPGAKVESVKLVSLTFTDAQMVFSVKLKNPNALKINLAGLDYKLDINDHSLVSGNKSESLTVAAGDSSVITLPVMLNYKKAWDVVKNLKNKKKLDYQLNIGLKFNLPVLGKVRIPVHFDGSLPLLKLPKVRLKGVHLKTFSWSGADLIMDIGVESIGGVPLQLKGLNYQLLVSGADWVSGRLASQKRVDSGGETVLSVPFKLNFLQMGRAVYNIIASDAPFDYKLKGSVKLAADTPLLKIINFDFDDISKMKIGR